MSTSVARDRLECRPVGEERTLPIRLSPTATSGSVRPCSWTFTSVAIFGSHNRCQSSSDFSLTNAACAGYLEKARWSDGFVCPHGEPFRFANRPGVLRCRKCRRDTGLTVGTVMARSHTPLSVWFWSAYLVSSQTPGMSAVQLRRQLGLSRGSTLHVVGAGNNRIGKERTTKF